MKVVFCSSEVVPFAKTGGLADVSGALPQALEKRGCRVKVALPKYRCTMQQNLLQPTLTEGKKAVKLGKDVEVYFVENNQYFDRDGLYGDNQGDYPDNLARFAFFCKQVLYLLKERNFRPEIIHCNDWQTALIPVYLSTTFKTDPFFSRTKTIFTIHNLAYQGLFPKEQFGQTGLDEQLFNMHALEFYGKINLLKGGLVFSHLITTVSPTYAREIQTFQFGCGLGGVLRERKKDLFGIINGLDYQLWDPAQDNEIFQKYDGKNLSAKYVNKERLQQELNLPCDKNVPLVGMVSRLAEQKGIDRVISALDKMAGLNLQFVLLGTGDSKYHQLLEKIEQKGYKNISINLRFDAKLAHKIYAGSDMFLIPSYYEPCGLGQLISFKYGTIPIVRKTGGLADTVIDYSQKKTDKNSGNGFVFEAYTSQGILEALIRAKALYEQKVKWQNLMLKVMDYDYSWETSAEEYIKLYRRIVAE